MNATAEGQAKPARAKLASIQQARWELSAMLHAARDPDPHAMFTVIPGTSWGSPERNATCLAVLFGADPAAAYLFSLPGVLKLGGLAAGAIGPAVSFE